MAHILKDVYASVTQTIIDALEAGIPPWVHPWRNDPGTHQPVNLASGRCYRGINVLLLNFKAMQCGYAVNRWLTYQQAKAVGAQVRRGEHGTEVVFFKILEVGQADATAAMAGQDAKVIPLLRSFTVFNADQIEGLPARLLPEPWDDPTWDACEVAESILQQSGARRRHGGNKAYYSPALDVIQLPERGAFATADGYYQVALHELTHWTGAPERCNRPLKSSRHIESYAYEELVAEMGSAFLTNHCGLPGVLQHAGYIENWLRALRNDKRLIFSAAAQAQKAADYLLPPTTEPLPTVAAHLAVA